MSNVAATINQMQNDTAQYKATTSVKSNEITGDTFLELMTKQLENQDPLDPMDNSQMLAQEAQFTSLSKTSEMSDNIAANNGVSQALAMVGSVVQLKDPDDDKKTITGVVQYAKLNGKNSSVVVNNKEYPVSSITNVTTLSNISLFNGGSSTSGSTTGGSTTGDSTSGSSTSGSSTSGDSTSSGTNSSSGSSSTPKS